MDEETSYGNSVHSSQIKINRFSAPQNRLLVSLCTWQHSTRHCLACIGVPPHIAVINPTFIRMLIPLHSACLRCPLHRLIDLPATAAAVRDRAHRSPTYKEQEKMCCCLRPENPGMCQTVDKNVPRARPHPIRYGARVGAPI